MHCRFRWGLKGLALTAALTIVSGCGGSDIQLGKVTGKVTDGGKPKAKVHVNFTPLAGGRGSSGATDADGRYELMYTFEKKGAVVGRHQIRVVAPEKLDSSDTVTSPSQDLVTVERDVESGSNVIDIELSEAK